MLRPGPTPNEWSLCHSVQAQSKPISTPVSVKSFRNQLGTAMLLSKNTYSIAGLNSRTFNSNPRIKFVVVKRHNIVSTDQKWRHPPRIDRIPLVIAINER